MTIEAVNCKTTRLFCKKERFLPLNWPFKVATALNLVIYKAGKVAAVNMTNSATPIRKTYNQGFVKSIDK